MVNNPMSDPEVRTCPYTSAAFAARYVMIENETTLSHGPPQASASPILVCMSRPRFAAPHLAARRCGRLPLEAGAAAIAASERRPVAGARGYPKGVFGACAPEGMALKCLLNILIRWAMAGAKRARTAETPKLPSHDLRSRASYFYPDDMTMPPILHLAQTGIYWCRIYEMDI